MRPTKNHIYCPASNKSKIQFKTQKKADNFIRYNAGEILEETGVAPVRSYYCTICCCWHVTSNPSTVHGEWMDRHDQKRIEIMSVTIQEMELILNKIKVFKTEVENLFDYNKTDDAALKLKEIQQMRNKMRTISSTKLNSTNTKLLRQASEIYDALWLRYKDERRLEEYTEVGIRHLQEKKNKTKRDIRLIELYTLKRNHLYDNFISSCSKLIKKKNNDFLQLLAMGNLTEAKSILDTSLEMQETLRNYDCDAESIDNMLTSNERRLHIARAVKAGEETALSALSLTPKEKRIAKHWHDNYAALAKLDMLVPMLDNIEDMDLLADTVKECRQHLNSIQNVSKKLLSRYSKTITKHEELVASIAACAIAKNRQKNTLLEIISRLEDMESMYQAGNFAACKQRYGECWTLLCNITNYDQNTSIIENYVDSWHDRLMAV